MALGKFRIRDPAHVSTASRKTKTEVELVRMLYSPHGNVKDVASNRAGHSHIPQALSGHYDTGDKVRDRGPSSQDGQTHDLFTNADRLSNLNMTAKTSVKVGSHRPQHHGHHVTSFE